MSMKREWKKTSELPKYTIYTPTIQKTKYTIIAKNLEDGKGWDMPEVPKKDFNRNRYAYEKTTR